MIIGRFFNAIGSSACMKPIIYYNVLSYYLQKITYNYLHPRMIFDEKILHKKYFCDIVSYKRGELFSILGGNEYVNRIKSKKLLFFFRKNCFFSKSRYAE